MSKEIKVIFLDVGNTLRVIEYDAEHILAAKRKVAELVGTDIDAEEFAEIINKRYDKYREQALVSWIESSEEELWTKFLAYDYPRDRIAAAAIELTYQFRQFKGRRVLVENGKEVVAELDRRGYQVGVISNVITSQELPAWAEEDGFTPLLKTLVQSSVTGIRKPDPKLFSIAVNEVGVAPEFCAYVGDHVGKDIVGAKLAGFGMGILIPPKGEELEEFTDENRPDAIINEFSDLLKIFPAAPGVTVGEFAPV